jgi:glycosyltransferase involved in cell wall biosynthesis
MPTHIRQTLKTRTKRHIFQLGRAAARHLHRSRTIRVGWVTANTLCGENPERFGHLGSVPDMRISNTAHWINRNSRKIWNEIYDPSQNYDIVVFVKAMDRACQLENERVQSAGGKTVFDANVNYYEIWGNYDIEGTRPTEQQQTDAIAMTSAADLVIADSTYLQAIAEKHNSDVRWIPDNVDLEVFGHSHHREQTSPIRLVWSGVAKKARPLLGLKEMLTGLKNVELVLVSDTRPEVTDDLQTTITCRFVPYTNRDYAQTLKTCHVIISPKNLINGYEMGHTEYKITLGMAAGLPAVASPQQSYREAVHHRDGGIIADSPEAWRDALKRLSLDDRLREQMGRAAAQTVREQYATPVVAKRYLDALESLM